MPGLGQQNGETAGPAPEIRDGRRSGRKQREEQVGPGFADPGITEAVVGLVVEGRGLRVPVVLRHRDIVPDATDISGMSGEVYIRFQSAEPNAEGRHPGFFGLINNLSRAGRLTRDQEEFRQANNAWYETRYKNPSTVDPTVYDHSINPGATAWFKASAEALVDRAAGYLEVLAACGVRCHRLVSTEPPGRVVYEDEHQIVVVPH